jgi:hypothetical protein
MYFRKQLQHVLLMASSLFMMKGVIAQSATVKLITLDPGHFHASLVQKSMYPQVDPKVYVYAKKSADLDQHLARIKSYNTQASNPTHWDEVVYEGDDFLSKMLKEKKGNVVVLA